MLSRARGDERERVSAAGDSHHRIKAMAQPRLLALQVEELRLGQQPWIFPLDQFRICRNPFPEWCCPTYLSEELKALDVVVVRSQLSR